MSIAPLIHYFLLYNSCQTWRVTDNKPVKVRFTWTGRTMYSIPVMLQFLISKQKFSYLSVLQCIDNASVFAADTMSGEGTPCVTLRRFLLVTHISTGQPVGVSRRCPSTSTALVGMKWCVDASFSPLYSSFPPANLADHVNVLCHVHCLLKNLSSLTFPLFRELCRSWAASPVSPTTLPSRLALCWSPASRARHSGDALSRCFCPQLLPLHAEMFPHCPQRWVLRFCKNPWRLKVWEQGSLCFSEGWSCRSPLSPCKSIFSQLWSAQEDTATQQGLRRREVSGLRHHGMERRGGRKAPRRPQSELRMRWRHTGKPTTTRWAIMKSMQHFNSKYSPANHQYRLSFLSFFSVLFKKGFKMQMWKGCVSVTLIKFPHWGHRDIAMGTCITGGENVEFKFEYRNNKRLLSQEFCIWWREGNTVDAHQQTVKSFKSFQV